jgi:hypothetical protein
MKAVKDATLDILEDTAVVSAKAIKAFLAYEGDNRTYETKAKVAASAISAFARTRASESNRMAVELMAVRVNGDAKQLR